MKKLHISIILSLFLYPLYAQTGLDIRSNLLKQSIVFPQEKVYIHTDKAAYVSGETIWYRIYLVDAALHASDLALSRYVYVDLVNPMGTVLSHSMIRPDEEDCYHNSITLDNDLPEGYYLLRGYTQYMLNRQEYIFQKKVYVSDPQFKASRTDINVSFTKTGNRTGSAKINFIDWDGNPIEVTKYTAGVDTTSNLQVYTKEKEISFRINSDKQQTLYVAFEYNNRVFHKYVSIPPLDEGFDITFHPEGGYLIAGAENVVGFKALNAKGVSEPVEVRVMDTEGNLVATAHSNALGMGKLSYYVQTGKEYRAICTNAQNIVKEVTLPKLRTDLYTLQASWQDDHLKIRAIQGNAAPTTPLWLVVHVRGMVVREGAIRPNTELTFSKALFPSGVVHILLLDNRMNPISERLVFCRNNDQAMAELRTERDNYTKRAHIEAVMEVKDANGAPLSGSYSVSVTDNSNILPEKAFTIESVLLLSSDLRGYIESPGYYFEGDDERLEDLDALLLTQGWRRYNVPEVAQGWIETPAFPPQQSQEISGVLRNVNSGKPILKGSVVLYASQAGIFEESVNGKTGRFLFKDLELPDSTRYILQADTKGRVTELVVDHLPVLKSSPFAPPVDLSGALFEISGKEYHQKANNKYIIDDGLRARELTPAVVWANRITREQAFADRYKSIFTGASAQKITHQMIQDEIIQTNSIISLLITNFPNLNYTVDNFGKPTFSNPTPASSSFMGGSSSMPIYVDDILMNNDFDIRSIPLTAIASIELMLRASSSLFGMVMPGRGGAIFIMTNKWGDINYTDYRPNPGIKTISPVGYKRDVAFYAPKYDSAESLAATQRDVRTTIHWKPNNTLIDGSATFDFYATDAETTYSMIVEGITNDGKIFRQVHVINRTER